MSKARDKPSRAASVCHRPNPTQKNQAPPRVVRMTNKGSINAENSRATQMWPNLWPTVATVPLTFWHMFRTAKSTRSHKYRKCGTVCTRTHHERVRISRYLQIMTFNLRFYLWLIILQDLQKIEAIQWMKFPVSTSHLWEGSTTMPGEKSRMKRTFKYFTRTKKSTKKYGHLSPFWEKDSAVMWAVFTINSRFRELDIPNLWKKWLSSASQMRTMLCCVK